MPRSIRRLAAPTPPTPAVRVVHGVAFRVTRRPAGISSPVTLALQAIARQRGSRQATVWGVFPVSGQDVVVAGYLSTRAPLGREHAFAIEPGAPQARSHDVVVYERSTGGSVGPFDDELWDGDCVDDFLAECTEAPEWSDLGATRLNPRSLPGGEAHDDPGACYLLLTDDGRTGEVVYGMAFWRPGAMYAAGRVETFTRAVGDDDAVRVVGVCLGRVHARVPLAVAPSMQCDDERAALTEIEREVRAVLDSDRRFGWYLVAGART